VRGIPQWLRVEIARLRESCDLVVAFPHWGPNMTVEPARWQRAVADELLAAGADLVAGHSSHVFHGMAFRPGGPVLYDLGDVVDDYATDPQLRNDRGVLAIWHPGEEPELELVALRLHYCYTEVARGEDADWIAARLEHACGRFGTVVRRTGEARFAAVTAQAAAR
jgi:hypothetical protein